MMFMTAKVDMKKILIVVGVIALLLIAAIWMFGGKDDTATTAAPAVSTNDGRVKFLTDFGWDVTNSPVETSQVRIPKETSDVFDRYNALQQSQGYDLSQYAGKNVMRFVYKINNFPGATEPVYATLLVYKNQIIGGDVTNTAAKGQIRPFQMPQTPAVTAPVPETAAETTANAATETAPQPEATS